MQNNPIKPKIEIESSKETRENLKRTSGFLKPTILFIWSVIKIVTVSLVVIIPIRYFLIQPFIVSGPSMEPNFKDGEYLIINEISYRFVDPQRGDVIVFRYPQDPKEYYIKRIIGLPKEKVQIKNRDVIIYNDQHPAGIKIDEPYLPDDLETPGNTETRLDENEYFVLGDNRFSSSDSRMWGTLPRSDIIGQAWIRCFPLSRFSVFKTPEYD